MERYRDWDEVFAHPREITVETLNTGYITGVREGMLNTRAETYNGQCKTKNAKLPVLSHLVTRESKHHLIDTGFDSSFSARWGGSFKGLIRPLYFKNRYMQPDASLGIEKQLAARGITPEMIYLTHAHEHCVGLHAFDSDIPLVMGKGERDVSIFPLVYSTQIKDKKTVRALDFNADGVDMPYLGRCIDVFGDGSFWAVDTHGHTKGHVSYLANETDRVVLLAGDVSITSLGFRIGVEAGAYSENKTDTKTAFEKLKSFANRYPHVELVFGHEAPGRFDIEYL